MRNENQKIKRMTAVALFIALAYVCMYVFRIKVSFLTFDAKDAVMTIGACFFGPVSGIIMPLIVALLELITVSDTGLYGFLMNFISSAAFCGVAALVYKYRRSASGALIAMGAAVVSMTATMMVFNLIVTPFYMGATVAEVAGMIPTLLLPFNIAKALLNAALVLILYKPVSTALHRAGFVSVSGHAGKETEAGSAAPDSAAAGEAARKSKRLLSKRTVISIAVGIAAAVAAILIFFLLLDGQFSLY